jgi:hypothetical protein
VTTGTNNKKWCRQKGIFIKEKIPFVLIVQKALEKRLMNILRYTFESQLLYNSYTKRTGAFIQS